MARVTPPARALRAALSTLTVGGAPMPQAVVEAIRRAFDADRAAVVGLGPRGDAAAVAFAVVAGAKPRELVGAIERQVLVGGEAWGELGRRYAAGGPRRVLAASDERGAELRACMACGHSLVAWMAVWRATPFDADEERRFAEAADLVEARLGLAHDVADAAALRAALAASLDALGAACVVDARGDVLTSSAAADALLEADRAGTLRRLQAAVHGHPGRSHAHVRRLDLGDAPARSLVVLDPPPSDRAELVERAAARFRLTPRQRETLGLVADGASNAAIAATLGVGERAVELHVTALLDKAGAANRASLLAAVFGVETSPASQRRARR